MGINPDRISDVAVRELKVRELQLKSRLGQLRGDLRTVGDEKDALMRKLQPQQDKFFEKMDKGKDALLQEKDSLHLKLNQLKVEQNSVSQLRDQLRIIDFEVEPLLRDIADLRRKSEDLNDRIAAKADERARLMDSLKYATVSEVDEQITKLDKQIATSTKKGETAVAAALARQKTQLEKCRRDILRSYEIDDQLIRARTSATTVTDALSVKEERRREIDEKKRALRDQLAAAPRFQTDFDSLRTRLAEISSKLDAMRQKGREEKPSDPRVAQLGDQLNGLRQQRDSVSRELDEVVAQIPKVTFPFDIALKGDIVGKGGATLQQLQADFGVAIDVDDGRGGPSAELILVGGKGDCDHAVAAIKEMLSKLAATRLKKTLTFDPNLARGLIGAKGANVDRIQRVSGAKVNVDSKEGIVTLTGSEEALQAATALVEEHIFQNAEGAMRFPPDMFDIVLGKGGATVRSIEETSGCKKIKIDREGHVISMFGPKDAVEKAKAAYDKLIQEMASSAFTMRVDQRMTRIIIGKGGQTINELVRTTGAIIDIKDGGTVTVRGPKDAVAKARQAIEELTRREEVKVPFEPVLLRVLIAPRIDKVPQRSEGGADGESERGVEVEGPCPLEDIRRASGCDQVSAIRSEAKIVLRGKRECVGRARELLTELFRTLKPDTIELPYHEVLTAYLTRRGTESHSHVERILADVPNLHAVDCDKASGLIYIVGSKEATRTAADRVKALLDAVAARVAVRKVPIAAIGSIIGPMGSRIQEIQRAAGADINVNRDKAEVQVFAKTDDGLKTAQTMIQATIDAAQPPADAAPGRPAKR